MTDQVHPAGEPVHEEVGELLELADETERAGPTGLHPAREALDRELREVKAEILRMGALVEDAIRSAIDALVSHDAEAASAVIVGDRAVNELQRSISGLITATIATQQPVARDLRFLLSLDHVTYELERMGDHAGSVAKQARKLAPQPPLRVAGRLTEMGEIAA
ncbi:MAG: phosphate signaling complex PhoU family protein, partial [Acidimicrobiales bacterium]